MFRSPLLWPDGWPRTKTPQRNTSFQVGSVQTRAAIAKEARLLNATGLVVTSDMPLKRDGEPYADADPHDPGVAIYFRLGDRDFVMARDQWDSPWHNLRSLTLVIESIRTIERHGGQAMMDRAFTGFAQLNSGPDWRSILGVPSGAGIDEVKSRYRLLASAAHPDKGGSSVEMAELNQAWEAAQREMADR